MKVETTASDAGTRTLTVEVPAEQVTQKIQQMFRRLAQEVHIPGFRRGKAPRGLLEMQFGKDVLDQDVQAALLEEAVPEALAQAELRPLSRPETRVVDYAEGKPFVFELQVEILPEVAFPDLSQVTVEGDPPPAPTEDDVTRVLEDLRVQHATLLPKTGPAELGDVAVIAVEGGQDREILLAEGSALSAQLVGRSAGETVEATLEEQTFSLAFKELKSLDRPDLDDLAKTLEKAGGEALLQEIRAQLQARLDHEHLQRTRYKVLDAVIANTDVPVPPRLKQEVIDHELNMLERSGEVGRLDEDDRASYAEGAAQRLQREVALEALKRTHPDLKLSDEAFETLIEEEAQARSLNPVKFKAMLERDKALSRFRSQKEDERALDYLVGQVQLSRPEAPAAEAPKAKPKAAEAAKKEQA